jgi:hypothetical protein
VPPSVDRPMLICVQLLAMITVTKTVATTRLSWTQPGTAKRVLSRVRNNVFGRDSVGVRPVTTDLSAHCGQTLRRSAIHRADSERSGGKMFLLLRGFAHGVP